MDAGIQAMDGNVSAVKNVRFSDLLARSLPSLDAGFRHPCQITGFGLLVYNDESWGLETSKINDFPVH